ncbi:Gfo/Idh/MocA family protein [Sandarakinorhabdus sp. DWP1-3-1]|uniref:Gfo/Idh/MocA family protein n=1 Tax=Sandarakinorhabdus sp. DWP1-3-1 TaxID=2804627 RepID=UPI003CF14BED
MTEIAPLRIGILGAANIARHFTTGVADLPTVEVVAVASRELATAEAFAARHGIPRALAGYEALLADPAVEAIYNPLPNSLHAEWSIRALEAGKHVLCEKPIAVTADDARAMFAAADRAGRLLVEAFPYRSQPQTLEAARLVGEGAIGRPRLIQAAFGFPMANPANIRLDPALGGGALLDAGSYPVSLISLFAGALPERVTALAQWSPRGVDMTLVANMMFADGLMAQAACSFGTGIYRRALIVGEEGTLSTDFLNHLTATDPGVLDISRGGWEPRREAIAFPATNGFRAEAEAFAAAVRSGPEAWNGIGPAESIEVMQLLDAIIASARADGLSITL